ncbi:DUF4064 domain-containing protein [Staphylococcus ursi]|uniref:DUF4064 domain-containing protein n=1 Tax=Staphylococcus sp. MI 10-1553 TaxID=1912064 RepID=UPI001398713C|nr:DUF4064 domain-containing protein [Staphylococcus sp. MI 10-1553]QHW36596.1 DUF4064 domain-containing protein [Staphylococcus sp. MI 10-1553]
MTNQYTYNEQQNNQVRSRDLNGTQKPFKRTVEKVLSWVGIVLHIIWILLLVGFVQVLQTPEFQQEIEATGQDIAQLDNIGSSTFLLALIPIVLAIVAVFIFKKNILAGILLILAAATGFFLTMSLISAVLWLIAGIMLIVRKPKRQDTVMYHENDNANNVDRQQATTADPYVYGNDTTKSVSDEHRVERESNFNRENHHEERNGYEQNIKDDTTGVKKDLNESKDETEDRLR